MSSDRHDAFTPEQLGAINSAITAAVSETVKAIFTQMAPTLQSIALTPEKLAEAEKLRRAPDPALVARERRERLMTRLNIEEAERNIRERQEMCSHKDANARWSVAVVHNFPDRFSRGICLKCHKFIQPTHYEIGSPTDKHPRGEPHLIKEDPKYCIIREIEAVRT